MVELNLADAYWDATGGRHEIGLSIRDIRTPVTVTNRHGITQTYPSGEEAVKDWPTGSVRKFRGGFFETQTRTVKRPERQAPLPVSPDYWSRQEKLLDEMYVDLR